MQIDFLEPWSAIEEAQEAMYFEQELYKEVASTSISKLAGFVVHAIARRIDCDNVLFVIDNESTNSQLAVVHLTWSGKTERLPWPITKFFASAEEFIKQQMAPDVIDYTL